MSPPLIDVSLPKAVVFDLDGTLVDSVPDLQASLNWMLASLGRPPLGRDAVIGMVGDGIQKLVERAMAATGGLVDASTFDQPFQTFKDHYAENAVRHTKLFPAVAQVLNDLSTQGVKLGVCTNKPEAPARTVLDAMGIAPLFQAVAGGDTLGDIRKPDARHLLHVLHELGVSIDEAVMVGDNHNDSAVAQAAGVSVVLVTFGYAHGPLEPLGADQLIDHFDDLPGALASLF